MKIIQFYKNITNLRLYVHGIFHWHWTVIAPIVYGPNKWEKKLLWQKYYQFTILSTGMFLTGIALPWNWISLDAGVTLATIIFYIDSYLYWIVYWSIKSIQSPEDKVRRDQFGNAPSQWEMTLHCNIISHWLGTYTKWSPSQHTLQHQYGLIWKTWWPKLAQHPKFPLSMVSLHHWSLNVTTESNSTNLKHLLTTILWTAR